MIMYRESTWPGLTWVATALTKGNLTCLIAEVCFLKGKKKTFPSDTFQ